jgi:ERCC4-type nuclease
MASKKMGYTIIRDSREHEGEGWLFEETACCMGTCIRSLKTGDYTIKGYEDQFVIERKKSISEFAGNVFQNRFEQELKRMEKFKFPFIILEFNMDDLIKWPPFYLRNKVRSNGQVILKRLLEFQLQYKTKIIFAGTHGKEIATSLFKRIIEHYAKQPERDQTGRFVSKT